MILPDGTNVNQELIKAGMALRHEWTAIKPMEYATTPMKTNKLERLAMEFVAFVKRFGLVLESVASAMIFESEASSRGLSSAGYRLARAQCRPQFPFFKRTSN